MPIQPTPHRPTISFADALARLRNFYWTTPEGASNAGTPLDVMSVTPYKKKETLNSS